MPKLFGTDGVRGIAGAELTSELAARLGTGAARFFLEGAALKKLLVVIGRDTRVSGPDLTTALAWGLSSAGASIADAGVIPTPAVAFLVTDLPAKAGAVVSASHNTAEYNGIKFFGPSGYKLSEAEEESVEGLMDGVSLAGEPEIRRLEDAEDRYIRHVLTCLEERNLDGIKVVVDCANGAAYRTSPRALEEAGAKVTAFNDSPNGSNINLHCGSTDPAALVEKVRELGADVGLAHDGDADRLIAVDEVGNLVDGDAILAVLAVELKEAGRLRKDAVVATVMSNLGFRKALEKHGIHLVETPVGDRYVLETMLRRDASLGGEQSGHIIFRDYATTGDGLITALRLLARMASTQTKLSDLASVIEHYPQVLLNIPVASADKFVKSDPIRSAVTAAEARLSGEGRILVRPSGTEPVVRVMVEAASESTAASVAEEVARVVEEELGR